MDEPSVNVQPARFRWPADYYSSETPAGRVPRWLVFGCGGGAALVLVLLFGAGAFLGSGGFADFMDLTLGMTVSEMKGMYAPAVSPAQRAALEKEIERVRTDLRAERVSIAALQPFLEELRKATSDKTVTADETERLRTAAHAIAPKTRR